jgi:hypothetical protein
VKNGSGETDTLHSAQDAIASLHRKWLIAAGAQVTGDPPVEINPLFALDAEELTAKLPRGTMIDRPRYFAS